MGYPTGSNVTNEVDPISRIEGHLGIAVEVSGGKVVDAFAHGNLWRGFENFLLGRHANDAITYTQRICGVCPVPHGLTSTHAVDAVLGYSQSHITFATNALPADGYGIPKKAVLIRNLVLSAEFLMSSITHFYHLAAPSYVQGPAIPPWTPYFANSYYNPLLLNPGGGPGVGGGQAVPMKTIDGTFSDNLWSTVIRSYVQALRIRRLTFEAGALFAGRMPMTSCYIGGGVTFDGTENLTSRCATFKALIKEVGLFVIQEYVPIVLALGALYPNFDNQTNAAITDAVTPYGNPSTLWEIAGNATGTTPGASNTGYGAGLGRFMSWGCFPNIDAAGTLALKGGHVDDAAAGDNFQVADKQDVIDYFITGQTVGSGDTDVPTALTEDIENSRYEVASLDSGVYTGTSAYPGDVSRTKPKRSVGYTYMKAPRWNGKSCEVGPLARLVVHGLYTNGGGGTLAGGGLAAQFAKYLKGAGINPDMVHADIAVALVRTGLAKLYSGGVTYGLDTGDTAPPTSAAALVGAYTAADAEIRGTIVTWITSIAAGRSTMDRLRARGLESLYLVQQMIGAFTPGAFGTGGGGGGNTYGSWGGGWVADLEALTGTPAKDTAGSTWRDIPIPTGVVQGWGAAEAPRGALMHQCTIDGGKIVKYQAIVPTTWNGSPQTGSGPTLMKGAIEAATIGMPFSTAGASFAKQDGTGSTSTEGGVEVLRAAQSFDPCIACAVH